MTPKTRDWAGRRRGELTRDRRSRQLSRAIEARRRLNARLTDDPGAKADLFGPSDPRYMYLTRSYD